MDLVLPQVDVEGQWEEVGSASMGGVVSCESFDG